MEKNTSGLIVAAFFFSPLLVVFWPIVFAVSSVYYFLDEPEISYRMRRFLQKKRLSYPLAALVGFIFMPLFYAVAPFLLSIAFFKDRWKKINVYIVLLGLATGVFGTPLFLVALALFSLTGHVIGILLLMKKLFICLRRCKDPSYLRPRIKYGYF